MTTDVVRGKTVVNEVLHLYIRNATLNVTRRCTQDEEAGLKLHVIQNKLPIIKIYTSHNIKKHQNLHLVVY